MLRFIGYLVLASTILGGCDVLSRDPVTENQVAVDFLVVNGEDVTAPVQAARYSAGLEEALVFVGDHGALTVTEIRLIAARFLLETQAGACSEGKAGCSVFRAEPFLVVLPLEDSPLTVARGNAPIGSYESLQFDVIQLSPNDDPALAEDIRELKRSIRRSLGEWPEDAGMVVAGTFTPVDATPRPFRAFFEAGFSVILPLEPQLAFSPTGEAGAVTVRIDLNHWFRDASGDVIDLSAYDYAQTGAVAALPGNVEQGFIEAAAESQTLLQ